MAKDKRVKGCTNSSCIKFGKKYHYNASDNFCVKCGSELTFVCKNCFRKLADEGPSHIICAICKAEIEDRKANAKKRVQHWGEKIEDVTVNVYSAIKDGAEDAANVVASKAKTASKLAGEKFDSIKDDFNERIKKSPKETSPDNAPRDKELDI